MKDLSRGLFACFEAGLLETTATARSVQSIFIETKVNENALVLCFNSFSNRKNGSHFC
jgi:hypothetical protein